ncbi:hypothetical protein [Aeoliella mucimassa]|uniref:Uncharacterized protein n=1 Tax=Aeoliella mucimassa TaxID=2527972 RepID=A0A518ALI5_9BACT|nr:hypothetical protein [Aeoliella mucimassa]QDU55595.1 hypothetical protein Pan181_17870 [Aeoliella mucimassa]
MTEQAEGKRSHALRQWVRFSLGTLLLATTFTCIAVVVGLWQIKPPKDLPQIITVLGPVTSGEKVALDYPTDDETLAAFDEALAQQPGLGGVRSASKLKDCVLIREKIADYMDATKEYYMIGKARLHHAHYRCSLYAGPDQEIRFVLVIDHQHLHMISEPAQGEALADSNS